MKKESLRQEAHPSLLLLISVAWEYFMTLPEAKRERLIRDFEGVAAA